MSRCISIIIPLYNQARYTRRCIEALLKNTNSDLFEIIVVDNHSTDETPRFLSSLHESVTVITNPVNMGFATACNQGAQAASCSYLLFLNNDTEVLPGWLEPLIQTLEGGSDIGAVGSKLLYPDGRIQHSGVIVIEQKNVCSLLPRHVFMGEDPERFPVDRPMCFQSLTAACLLVRKKDFISLDGFDEAYWNGCEDVDFCFRLLQIGKKLIYQPQSVVVHHESRSGQERQVAQPRNNARLRNKWDKLIQPDIIQEGSYCRRGPSRIVRPFGTDHPDSVEFIESAIAWWTNKSNSGWRVGNSIIRFIEKYRFWRTVLPDTNHKNEIFNPSAANRHCDSAIINSVPREFVCNPEIEKNLMIPEMRLKTDIVICVHDALDDLKRCLDSVIRNTPESCCLIFVNDGSAVETTDFMRQFVQMHPAQCILLENPSARGYTLAANQGLLASTAEQVILLNSDTIVPGKWIERLTQCAVSDPAIGIVGPLSNAASWQSIPTRFRPDGDWAVNKLPQVYSVDKMAEIVYRMSSQRFPRVDFVNGFCFLIKRSLIQSIGLLDENAFPDGYGEENDYCLRAIKAGFDLAIADHAYVYHAKSKSYSHERRIELSRKGAKSLANKHGARLIKKGTENLRKQTDLAELRLKIRNHLAEKRANGK
jgi:GT2 family glycosyltransferase